MGLGEKYENEEYWEFYSVCRIKMTKFGAGSLAFKFGLFHLLLAFWLIEVITIHMWNNNSNYNNIEKMRKSLPIMKLKIIEFEHVYCTCLILEFNFSSPSLWNTSLPNTRCKLFQKVIFWKSIKFLLISLTLNHFYRKR